jgi:hypothetical protein
LKRPGIQRNLLELCPNEELQLIGRGKGMHVGTMLNG